MPSKLSRIYYIIIHPIFARRDFIASDNYFCSTARVCGKKRIITIKPTGTSGIHRTYIIAVHDDASGRFIYIIIIIIIIINITRVARASIGSRTLRTRVRYREKNQNQKGESYSQ